MIELERTFLLKFLPEGLDKCKKEEIEDIYIPETAEHPIIRIRKSGNGFEITKKSPMENDSSEQREHTIKLTQEEFIALSNLKGKKLVKTRYHLSHNGRIAHIDVFHGPLEGLVTADFEFKNREEKEGFVMPEFCLVDVTQEKFIAGGMLCGKSYDDIKEKLESVGYRKII